MTMKVAEALELLGAKRVIWIDDRFNKTSAAQLAQLLTNNIEVSRGSGFEELNDGFDVYDIDSTAGVQQITQLLVDLPEGRFAEIETTFRARQGAERNFPTNELSMECIDKACELMGIKPEDRWTFEKADKDLLDMCSKDDSDHGYIVDLNDSGGSEKRGLDALRLLWKGKSRGTAFILTHETGIAGEGDKEASLRDDLADLTDIDGLGLPISVIAKERLTEKSGSDQSVEEALTIGVKRAGLRRSMHDVLVDARAKLCAAIDGAARRLLAIPPEQLEAYVFERGYKEGVSELHVVERAITAYVGKEAREFFGADDKVHASATRLRALRHITLDVRPAKPHEYLSEFREAEIWEAEELLNRSLTPIACGDVFELDREEQATKTSKQKFVLLAQPCDISLRPEEHRRAQETAFLVPLRTRTNVGKSDPKSPLLPFILRGEQWSCEFREASIVKLCVLDFASFRADGRVRFDDGQPKPTELLVAQQNVYPGRAATASRGFVEPKTNPTDKCRDLGLQLSFSSTGAFKHIYSPTVFEASSDRANSVTTLRPKRLTWHLKRCGRIRMPYAAALLDQYTTVMSRHAFDLDYMSPGNYQESSVVVPPVAGALSLAVAKPAPAE